MPPLHGSPQPVGVPPGAGYDPGGQPGSGTQPSQFHPAYLYPGNPPQGVGYPHLPPQPVSKEGLAEWWQRLLARVIDGIILAAISAPFWIPPWIHFITKLRHIADSYPLGAQLANIPAARNAITTAEGHLFGQLLLVLLLFYLLAFGYDWLQHALWGQTIGKRALGTRVVREQSYTKISLGAAGGRAAIYALLPLVPLVGWIFGIVNELWLTWDPRRQCVHDKGANTVVVKKEYLSSQPWADGWQAIPPR